MSKREFSENVVGGCIIAGLIIVILTRLGVFN